MTKDKEPLEEEKNQNSEESELNTLSYEEVLSQLEAAKEDSLRARAELENFKKRTSLELSNALKFANSELLSSLIPVLTSLEKATENLDDEKKGIISSVLKKEKTTTVSTTLNFFDMPNQLLPEK